MADNKDNSEYIPSFEDTEEVPASFENTVEVPQTATPEVSALQGFGTGLQEGATFGFADELAGAAGALGGLSGGDVRPMSEIYQEARDEARAENARIREGAPVSSFVGNIAGGAIPTALVAPAAIGKNLSLGQKALQGAQNSWKLGGLAGLGTSEADNVQDALIDTGLGVVVGAGTGALLPVATQGLGKGYDVAKTATSKVGSAVGNLFRKTSYGDDIGYALEKGLEGEFVVGPQAIAKAEQAVIDARDAAEKQITDSLKLSGKAKSAFLKKNANKVADLDPVYENALKELETIKAPTSPEETAKYALKAELERLQNRARASGGDLIESDAQKMGLQRLSKVGQISDPFPKSPETSRLAKNTSRAVRQAVEAPFEQPGQINPLGQLNQRYEAGAEAQDLLPSLQDITKTSKQFEPGVKDKLAQFENLFKQAVAPEVAEEAAKQGTKLAPEQIKQAGYEYLKSKNINKPVGEGLGKLVSTALTSAPIFANVAGVAVKNISDAIQKVASLPSDKITVLADLLETAGKKYTADLLRQVLNTQGNARNAALFMLSQDKGFKQTIFGTDEENNE